MRFLLFMLLMAYLATLGACTKSSDLTPPAGPTSQAEGFAAIRTEYTDAGVFVKKDSIVKVCTASGDYLQNLKTLYANKPNDTLRGFYNYKVVEYKFTAPYCH